MTDKTMFATRDFTDAGTERSYERNKPITDVEAGVMGNYIAAGLATDEEPTADPAEPDAEATPAATKPARRSS